MELTLLAGSANTSLTEAVAGLLGVQPGKRVIQRFPDGEFQVELQESVRGHDVYIIQSTSPPAEQHLLELLLLNDACRRAGAARLTVVVPYFGYARQDRRVTGRAPIGARLVADLIGVSGIDRVVAVDLHTAAIEGFFTIPLEHLSAVPRLAEAVRPSISPTSVVVAPDLGAAKLADRYGQLLDLPVAIVHKTRISGEEVQARSVAGDIRGRAPLIVDDMISTGGTVEAAANAALAAGCVPEITVVATHGLFVGPALERLHALPVHRVIVTDSVAAREGLALPLQVVSLAPLLAEAIRRLHENKSLGDLTVHE